MLYSTFLFCFCFFFFFFFFMATLVACGSSAGLGLNPAPQPEQHQVRAASVTYAAFCSTAGSLTHEAKPGIKPASSRRQCQALNLLSHNKNSSRFLFILYFIEEWLCYSHPLNSSPSLQQFHLW